MEITYKCFQASIRIQYISRSQQIHHQQCFVITALFHGAYMHMSIAQERSSISILLSVLLSWSHAQQMMISRRQRISSSSDTGIISCNISSLFLVGVFISAGHYPWLSLWCLYQRWKSIGSQYILKVSSSWYHFLSLTLWKIRLYWRAYRILYQHVQTRSRRSLLSHRTSLHP